MTTCAMGAMAGAVMSRRRSSRVPWKKKGSNTKGALQMRCHISMHQSYILRIFLLKIWVNQKKKTISSILGDGGCPVSRSPRGQKWPLVRRWLASTLAPPIPLWLLWRFWSLVIIWRSDHWRCWASSGKILPTSLAYVELKWCFAIQHFPHCEAGSPTVIPNAEGARTTPSVVAYSKSGELLVGQIAKRQDSGAFIVVWCCGWRLVDVSSFQSVCFRGRFAFDRLWWIQRTPSTQWSALLVASPTKWRKSWKRCPTRLTSRARKWRSTALWWARSLLLRRSLHRFCASWVRMPESTWVPPFKRRLSLSYIFSWVRGDGLQDVVD